MGTVCIVIILKSHIKMPGKQSEEASPMKKVDA